MSGDMIRVVVVDDHLVVRSGLKMILSGARDIEIIGETSNGRDAVALVERFQPDVVVMDLAMAQKDGITEISGVVRGNNGHLIAYQGDPTQDHARRSTVDVAQAKDAPADKSLSDLGQLQQQAPQRPEQAQPQRAMGM